MITMIRRGGAVLTGLGIGAGLMYFLDPERGRRRRALVKDKVAHSAHVSAAAMGTTARDLAHRASGAIARARGTLRQRSVDDVVLVERVRARLGRLVSHPHAVVVDATAGRVRVRGPIVWTEVNPLLQAIGRVRGVREVVNALEQHEEGSIVSALHGSHTPPAPKPNVWRREWTPGAILAASALGLLALVSAQFGELKPGRGPTRHTIGAAIRDGGRA